MILPNRDLHHAHRPARATDFEFRRCARSTEPTLLRCAHAASILRIPSPHPRGKHTYSRRAHATRPSVGRRPYSLSKTKCILSAQEKEPSPRRLAALLLTSSPRRIIPSLLSSRNSYIRVETAGAQLARRIEFVPEVRGARWVRGQAAACWS